MGRRAEDMFDKGKAFDPLCEGDMVFVQNQDPSSRSPRKWDRQGTIVATGEYDQYLVRVSGSGRLTLRNRRFLRKVPAAIITKDTYIQPFEGLSSLINPSSGEPKKVLLDGRGLLHDEPAPNPLLSMPPTREAVDVQRSPIISDRREQEISTTMLPSVPDCHNEVDKSVVFVPHRSSRVSKQTQFYDASSGT